MDVAKHQPGMFSWADMPVLDIDKAQDFYTRLLGLNATSNPVGPDMTYVMLDKAGKSSCALYAVSQEAMDQRGGAWWQSYFTVEDVDASAEKAKALGGTIVYEPVDVFDAGRMAIIIDPIGAVFAIWQPRANIGAEVFGEPGALAWNELYTHDVEKASAFYGGLFGWNPNPVKAADGGDYTMFDLGGQPACGMMAIRPEWGEMPSNWSIYLAVENLEESLKLVEEMDGKVVSPVMEVENVGRFSFIQDSTGAYLSIIQIAERSG